MSFLSPWMLLLGLSVLAPPALHMIASRRARQVDFAAFHFLTQQRPKRRRMLLLDGWVLVSLRMAALSCLTLAFARPTVPWFVSPESLSASESAASLVLIIDNSLSMGTKTMSGPSRLELGRAKAKTLISQMPTGSKFAVISSSRPVTAVHGGWTGDRAEATRWVDSVRQSAGEDDAAEAIALSRRLLGSAGSLPARVLVLSDLQERSWASLVKTSPEIEWAQVGESLDDVSLAHLQANEELSNGRPELRVTARVQRHSSTSGWRGTVTLRWDESEQQEQIELRPGQVLEVDFMVPRGTERVTVSVSPGGANPLNDTRELPLVDHQRIRTLVVNGAPGAIPREDETFFLVRALQAASRRTDELALSVASAEQLEQELTSPWDVVILANVAELSQPAMERLTRALHDGVGVWVTAGDGLGQPSTSWLQRLLPPEVHHVGAARGATSVGATQSSGDASLKSAWRACRGARVARRLKFKPSPSLQSYVPGTYQDGTPAMVTAQRGRGRLIVWATSVDRDWTELPLHPCFVPLTRASLLWAADRSDRGQQGRVFVGQTALLSRGHLAEAASVLTPSGERLALTLRQQPPGLWRLPPSREVGVYELTETQGARKKTRTILSVSNPAEDEIDLTELSAQVARGPLSVVRSPSRPAWSVAFIALLGLLVCELWWLWRTTATSSLSASNGARH